MDFCTMRSPIGVLTITEDDGAITEIRFHGEGDIPPSTPVLQQAVAELTEYFAGLRREFTLPLSPRGTAFQRQVWQALRAIPYGQTRTYGQIAEAIGRARACRAVGMANHTNPLPIVIPCHRVVGSNGSLTGYAGGLDVKTALLQLERAL